jgi:DNA-binding transcriptional LysR family regulator
MLTLRLLRCFVVVADELSFTAAAEHLNMAQPALSRAIKELEAHLGARLLDRDTRNVRLTTFGREFLPEAQAVLERFDRAERVGRDMGRGIRGKIKIGYTTFVAHDPIAPLLRKFTLCRPDVSIDLHNMGTEQQRNALIGRSIDIAFMVGPFSIPNISTRMVKNDDLIVVMPLEHRLANHVSITATDLSAESLIMGRESSWSVYRRRIFREFTRLGVSPRITQEAPTPSAIMALVSAGMGVTIFPRAYSESFAGHLTRRPFEANYNTIEIICAWIRNDENPLLAALLDDLPPGPQ